MRNKFGSLTLAGLLAIGMAGSVAVAQDTSAPPQQEGGPRHHGMDPDAQLKHMTKELDLTADQQAQIKPILESQRQQMMAVHEDQSLSREDRFSKMKAIHQDSETKIEATLNDTQKQKYAAMQARMQERMQDRSQGGQAPQQ